MDSSTAKLIAKAWQTNARTITLPDGSIAAIPQRPDGMKDEWIAMVLSVAPVSC